MSKAAPIYYLYGLQAYPFINKGTILMVHNYKSHPNSPVQVNT